jgi:hypothetical protein
MQAHPVNPIKIVKTSAIRATPLHARDPSTKFLVESTALPHFTTILAPNLVAPFPCLCTPVTNDTLPHVVVIVAADCAPTPRDARPVMLSLPSCWYATSTFPCTRKYRPTLT